MQTNTQDHTRQRKGSQIPKWDKHPGFQEASLAECREAFERVYRKHKKLAEMLART